MSDEIRLSAVTLDCPDAVGLAKFYAGITGGELSHAGDGWACVLSRAGRINFQTVPGYTPPVWPDATSSIMMHLDFMVVDRDAAEARVLAAGAAKYDFQPNSEQCHVYADPAGHPFCPTTWEATATPPQRG